MISIHQARVGTPRSVPTFAKATTALDNKRIDELFGTAESTMKTEFIFLVSQLREQVDPTMIEYILRTGSVTNIILTTERLALHLGGAWAEIFQEGGDLATGFINESEAGRLKVRFDLTNERAVQAVRQNSMDLVREVTDEQRATFQQVIEAGVREGLNPREVARDLRDSVGLTRYQEQVVQNYRTLLENNSAQALNRELRDARSDRSVRAAIDADKPLAPETIDRMVERYRDNWINFRAETIARTEGLRASSMGIQEGFQQAVDQGGIEEGQVTRTWKTELDGREREWHAEMNGQVRGLNEPFESGRGNLLQEPRDPSAPVEESANCRCRLLYRLV